MIRLLLTLALLLALPAQATINAISSQHIILRSFDGSRYSEFPAGDKPQNPGELIYFNGFDGNPTNSIDPAYGNIGLLANQSDILIEPPSINPGGSSGHVDGPDFSIVTDPSGGTNKVLKAVMQGGSSGVNWEADSTIRHRVMVRWGYNLINDSDKTALNQTGGNGLRAIPDVEYWMSFRYRMDCTGTMGNDFFLFDLMTNSVGESAVYGRRGCDGIDVAAESYKTGTTWGAGTTPPADRVANTGITAGAWHCIVARLIRKPYSVGAATSYKPGVTDVLPADGGDGRAGIFEVWVDGVKKKGSAADTADTPNGIYGPRYTGADRKGRTKLVGTEVVYEFNPSFRTGIYWSTEPSDNSGKTVTLYQDDVKIMQGENLYDSVNCQ